MTDSTAGALDASEPSWPCLPLEVLAELERIEFRVTGEEARAACIEQLMHDAEQLRGEIAQWVRRVRGVSAAVTGDAD